jgi:hypothetical protein
MQPRLPHLTRPPWHPIWRNLPFVLLRLSLWVALHLLLFASLALALVLRMTEADTPRRALARARIAAHDGAGNAAYPGTATPPRGGRPGGPQRHMWKH